MIKDTKIAKRYARALFDIASEDQSYNDWLDKLKLISATEADKGFANVLNSTKISLSKKMNTIDEVFKNELNTLQLNFLKLLTKNQSFSIIQDIHTQFLDQVEKSNNIIRVSVTSPYKISDDLKDQISNLVNEISGSESVIEERIDSELIGGVVIRLGDTVIDGSIKNKVKQLRRELV
jgi:F-type H+-transporting ATPase subunit delta